MAEAHEFDQQIREAFGTQFALERELPGGGMSRVYLATERALNRKVVIKVLPPELAAGVNRERFRREIQLAAQLQHPHIVPVFAVGAERGVHYYAMQFIEGRGLDAVVRELRDGQRVGAPLLPTALSARCGAVGKLGAAGFDKSSMRQFAMWDPRNTEQPFQVVDLDQVCISSISSVCFTI